MPGTPHVERHFKSSETVRDVVIGMSDGLTVPFALAAGLTGAIASSRIVVVAGLAEIAAGSIAMGLGGYLAARTDFEHYNAELAREYREIREIPEAEEREIATVIEGYGLTPEQASPVVSAIRSDPKRWVDFMMRYELGLEEPDPRRALRSAIAIALSYIIGGLIPLSPYMLMASVRTALWFSVVVTLAALFAFGYTKGRLTGIHPLKGGLRTVIIGGLAAAAAFGMARLIS